MLRMTAIKMGFYGGRMVRPGTDFDYDDSLAPLIPLPRWAVLAGTPLPSEPVPNPSLKPPLTMDDLREHRERCIRAGVVDIKPLDAQLAVYQKTGDRPSPPIEHTLC